MQVIELTEENLHLLTEGEMKQYALLKSAQKYLVIKDNGRSITKKKPEINKPLSGKTKVVELAPEIQKRIPIEFLKKK